MVTVVVTLPKPVGKDTRLYERDRLTPDDHLQSFTIDLPSYAATGSTTFRLSVTKGGRGGRLHGNTSDYSVVERIWQLYAEVEAAGPIRGARSNTLDLFWTG